MEYVVKVENQSYREHLKTVYGLNSQPAAPYLRIGEQFYTAFIADPDVEMVEFIQDSKNRATYFVAMADGAVPSVSECQPYEGVDGLFIANLDDYELIQVRSDPKIISVELCEVPTIKLLGILDGVTAPNKDSLWYKERIAFRNATKNSEIIEEDVSNPQPVVVYLVDSGVNTNNVELQNANIRHGWSLNDNTADERGHGTAMASLIVGKTLGLSPTAELVSVKVTDAASSTTLSDVIDALNFIRTEHTRTPTVAKVVNCSWGMSRSLVIETVIRSMMATGIVFVVAAGNSGVNVSTVTPAAMREVITVGATDQQNRIATFSNFASDDTGSVTKYTRYLDIYAPRSQYPHHV